MEEHFQRLFIVKFYVSMFINYDLLFFFIVSQAKYFHLFKSTVTRSLSCFLWHVFFTYRLLIQTIKLEFLLAKTTLTEGNFSLY